MPVPQSQIGEGKQSQLLRYIIKQLDRLQKITASGGGGGGGAVDITAVGGNPVTTTVPVSGTVTANLGTIAGAATAANQTTANGSLSSIDTKLTSQATAANQTTGNNSLSTLVTNSTAVAVTGAAAQTAVVNNILGAASGSTGTSTVGYNFGSVQVVSTGTAGTFIFEFANADGNYQTMPVWNNATLTGTPITAAITATNSQIIYYFPITTNFIRLRIATTITGGSIQALSKLGTCSPYPSTFQVAQATAANLNVTAAIASAQTLATVTTVSTLTTLANGQTAHSAASTGNPLRMGGRVAPTTIATQDTTLVAGDASEIAITTAMQQVTKANAGAELDYNFILNSVATTTTLQPLVLASGTASIRNYISSLMIQSDAIGAAGTAWVLDGQGAIGTSVTIATPGVFTSTAHDLKVGDAIVFTSLGTITGVSTNTVYYITATSFTATTFTVATTQGGTALQITGSTSAFTFYRVLHQLRFQTTGVPTPMQLNFTQPLRSIGNGAINFLIPVSMTSGNIYLTVNGYRGF